MIRELRADEVHLCVKGGKAFFKEAKLPGEFCPEVFVGNFQRMIEVGRGVIFGMFDESGLLFGALGALVCPNYFNSDTVAVECFWHFEPHLRGRGLKLFGYYEDWAVKKGVSRIGANHLMTIKPKQFRKFYERRGFVLHECIYVKCLPIV